MKKQLVGWMGAAAACVGLCALSGCNSESKTSALSVDAGGTTVGPEVPKTIEDYRKQKFEAAIKGLRFEGGMVSGDLSVSKGVPTGRTPADAAAFVVVGRGLIDENDYSGAVGQFRSAILTDATNVDAYIGLGDALICKKQDEKALMAYRTAMALDGTDASTHLKYAETTNRVGDLSGWAAELERLIARHPDHGEAHARLAVARYYLGDLDGAERELAQAERLGGDVPSQLKGLIAEKRGTINN